MPQLFSFGGSAPVPTLLPVLIRYEAGQALGPVCMLWRNDSLFPQIKPLSQLAVSTTSYTKRFLHYYPLDIVVTVCATYILL
jgi:hypothetical protein